MDCIEFKIETTTAAVEAISYFIADTLEGGVEICDPKDAINQDKTQTWYDFIDESLLDADMNTVFVKAYFNKGINIEEYKEKISAELEHIKEFLDVGAAQIIVSEIPEEKWANEWKKYYKTFNITDKIVIKPSWLAYDVAGDEIVIEMDPGMAFGSGTHETTSMCVQLLEKYLKKSNRVLDVGTGSGILGIVAAKLGASVLGVDIDPMSVKVAIENVAINGVADDMAVVQGDLLEVVAEKADIVISNIIADVIIVLAAQVRQVLKPGGVWIASGIIDTKKAAVLKAVEKHGWEVVEVTEKNEWVALAMRDVNA
ncbi:50S ribosomal protein L11 methyltransferase [Candidatus Epulonipiscium viviparus]|uniref:50S ribosomal protein L11 methyltransferase n=1 Tax=Candidatus Epulonipiscium viviparus TaxID=420336 RepID=UPI00016C0485|nr:50S ribosomal protein L11 methyltransferase [Candidatus Epulopiscium viviparus]